MPKLLMLIVLSIIAFSGSSQIVFWSDDFENLQSTQAFYNNLDNQIEFQHLPINCNILVFVSNIEGKAIDNFKIESTDGQYKWRSSHPLSGVLLVSLITFDEVRTIKLVVN